MANEDISTRLQVATDAEFTTLSVDESTAYATSRAFTKDALPYGVDLYTRVQHIHTNHGTTPWSPVVKFSIIIPATIIGVCLDNTTTKGTFYWIDAMGNKLGTFVWRTH